MRKSINYLLAGAFDSCDQLSWLLIVCPYQSGRITWSRIKRRGEEGEVRGEERNRSRSRKKRASRKGWMEIDKMLATNEPIWNMKSTGETARSRFNRSAHPIAAFHRRDSSARSAQWRDDESDCASRTVIDDGNFCHYIAISVETSAASTQ